MDAAIEARRVSMAFHQARLSQRTSVLDDIDLSAGRGEFVSIVGPSGCGKTTLLHILDGLLPPTRGEVLVDGHPVTRPGRERAMVFQDPALLPWRTVLKNVMYGLECLKVDQREARRTAEWWLEVVGLSGFALHYPHELSGGMQQRVNLARALAVEPDILLMDEPFAALDAQTRDAMQAELLAIWERSGRTVIFVTHHIGEAIYLADRVVILSPRPARVRDTIPVALSRPRDEALRQTGWARDCEAHIRNLLRNPNGAGWVPVSREAPRLAASPGDWAPE